MNRPAMHQAGAGSEPRGAIHNHPPFRSAILRNVSLIDNHPARLKPVARGLTMKGGDGMHADHFKGK